MDGMLNSKREKESIYEIYRACRLCGGGAGYKMPIIQNIVDLDEADVELKQKIRDCVQIEVHQDDKMPPLICELCVDKVNDFYEFLEMCRQTNKRTRLRLGLPPQSLPRGAPDAGDCILGLTEPVFVNEDSDGEPLAKHKKSGHGKASKVKKELKREPIVRIKIENLQRLEERSSRQKNKRERTPPRVTRHSRSKDDDDAPVSLKDTSKPSKPVPKSILKRENSTKSDSSPILSPRLKRTSKEPAKLETPSKRVKVTIKAPPQPQPKPKLSPKLSPRLSPKTSPRLQPKPKPVVRPTRSPVVPPKKAPSPPPPREEFGCTICGQQYATPQARSNHMRGHIVGFTSQKLACNPCGEWFASAEEAANHHKNHKRNYFPYSCRKCQADFKRLTEFDEHIENNECLPSMEVPDVKCEDCWQLFATNNLLEQHKCLGEDHRPGGKCSKCNRSYALQKNLKKHESTCTAKKKGELTIDKALLSKLKPIQIRVARCDPLLTNVKQEHYDVSSVSSDYGLDTNCYYPYISGLHIKSEFRGMVNIQDEIKRQFCSEDYVHWDSSDDDDDEDDDITCDDILNAHKVPKRRVPSLSALTLKTIFSHRLLGKVPRKKRKLKAEKVFDSILGESDEVRMDIGSIIDNLEDDDRVKNCDVSFSQDLFSDKDINDKVNDIDDKVNDIDMVNDSQASNNVSSNDNVQDVNKNDDEINNKNINDNDTEMKDVLTKDGDDNFLESLSQDSNSQSLLDDNLKENDSNIEFTKKYLDGDSIPSNNSDKNSDVKENDKNDSIDDYSLDSKLNSEVNNASKNLEFKLNKINNDSEHTNDSRFSTDSLNKSFLDEIDAQIRDSNLNNKISNENDNDSADKIVLEDLLSKSSDSKLGLGSIEDYNFDS